MKNLPHQVKLVNNPYLQRLSILIDGKNISPYSSLHQHINAPFSEWCDCILDDIAKQFNDESFLLTFSSCAEEMFVMQALAAAHPFCNSCVCVPWIRDTATPARLKKLHELIRDKNIRDYEFQNLFALFVVSDEIKMFRRDLLGLEIKNSFCKLQTEIVSLREFWKMHNHSHDILFVLTVQKLSDAHLNQLSKEEGFLIQISDTLSESIVFDKKIGKFFAFYVQRDFLIQAIFKCLLFMPLIQILRRCIASLPSETKSLYKKSLEDVQSTTNRIIPVAESNTIELGQSIRIRFDSDIATHPISVGNLSYTYSRDGIIRCNGLLVEGLREGYCTMYIQRTGETVPCAEISFNVIKRNRIQEIIFTEQKLIIGEGCEHIVKFSVSPTDADNFNKITWHTTDSAVALIENGRLKAKKQGICNISCVAENVSASFRCVVKPFLVAIVPEEEEMEVACGDKKLLKIRIIPENAIDGQLLISSMDMRVANVVGQEVHGVGKGTTRIVIENVTKSIRKEVIVEVFKKGLLTTVTKKVKKKFFGG